MKARALLNLVLIAALAGLGLLAYYKPWQNVATSIKITQLKRAEINHITIEPRDAAAIKLEKHNGTWRIVAPLKAQAEATLVDRVIDVVDANAKQRLANAGPDKFDLHRPLVRVTLNDETLAFGRVNDITYEQYVGTAQGVFLLPPLYGYGIPTEIGKLLSRRLLDEGAIPVSFIFNRHRIERDDKGTWKVSGEFTQSKDHPLTQDDFNRWADEWRYTSALSVEPATGGHAREQVTVRFKSGQAVKMGILQKAPDFQLSRSDNALRYRFGAEVGQRLLDPRVVAQK